MTGGWPTIPRDDDGFERRSHRRWPLWR